MKIKNLFLIPFILFNCEKKSDDRAKIKKFEDDIRSNFSENESYKKIQNLNFDSNVYDFAALLQQNYNCLGALAALMTSHEVYFKFLCNYDFSNDEDKLAAKEKLGELAKEFIELQKEEDKKDIPLVLGKIIFLVQHLDAESLKDFFEQKENEKNTFNLLTLVLSVYCEKVLGRSLLEDISNQNATVSQREYDRIRLAEMGEQGDIKFSKTESALSKDDKVKIFMQLPASASFVLLHGEDYDSRKYIYDRELVRKGNLSQDTACFQIVNLYLGIDRYASIPNFSLGQELIKIIAQLPKETIDNNTFGLQFRVLPACCEIFKKIAERQKEPRFNENLGIADFAIFVRRLKKKSITTSEDWKNIVSAFSLQEGENLTEETGDNYSKHVEAVLDGLVLNSNELTLKTLSLLKNKSLDCKCLVEFCKKIEEPESRFSKKEDFQELFRKLDYGKIDNTTFNEMVNLLFAIYGARLFSLDRDTFIGMLTSLSHSLDFDKDKKKFSFDKTSLGAVFLYECSDEEQKEIKGILNL